MCVRRLLFAFRPVELGFYYYCLSQRHRLTVLLQVRTTRDKKDHRHAPQEGVQPPPPT